jgi:hypothetical protein
LQPEIVERQGAIGPGLELEERRTGSEQRLEKSRTAIQTDSRSEKLMERRNQQISKK